MNFYYRFCLGFLALSFLVSNGFADAVDTIDQNNRGRMSIYNSPLGNKSDDPMDVGKLASYTNAINGFLNDRNKVDINREATSEQKKKMLQAVMSTALVYIQNGLSCTELNRYVNHGISQFGNEKLFKHFEILKHTAELSVHLFKKLFNLGLSSGLDLATPTANFQNIERSLTKQQQEDFKILTSYSNLDKETIFDWFAEISFLHLKGIVRRVIKQHPEFEALILSVFKDIEISPKKSPFSNISSLLDNSDIFRIEYETLKELFSK